jgi:putative mRNA 3-end processing factor
MQIRQRVKQRRVELPLIISDHADWDELTQTIREVNASTIWVTHGQEDALVHYARGLGLEAAPISLQGRDGEEAA